MKVFAFEETMSRFCIVFILGGQCTFEMVITDRRRRRKEKIQTELVINRQEITFEKSCWAHCSSIDLIARSSEAMLFGNR